MNDIAEQQDNPPLVDRLLMRHKAPIGVIDVHQPQRLYDRRTGWQEQRREMLESLRQGYTPDTSQPAGQRDLVLKSFATLSEASAGYSTENASSAIRTMKSEARPVAPKTQPEVIDAAVPLLRVSRRRVGYAATPDTSSNSSQIMRSESTETVDHRNKITGEDLTHQLSEMNNQSSKVASSPDPDTQVRGEQLVMAGRRGLTEFSTPPQTTEGSDTTLLAKSSYRENAFVKSAGLIPHLRLRSAGPKLARSPELSSAIVASGNFTPATVVPGFNVIIDMAKPLPLTTEKVEVTAASPMLWRSRENYSPTGRVLSSEQGSTLPLKREAALPRTQTVLRQADQSGPTTSTAPISATIVAESPNSNYQSQTVIDVALLAGRVSRLLTRQMVVERERRGIE